MKNILATMTALALTIGVQAQEETVDTAQLVADARSAGTDSESRAGGARVLPCRASPRGIAHYSPRAKGRCAPYEIRQTVEA